MAFSVQLAPPRQPATQAVRNRSMPSLLESVPQAPTAPNLPKLSRLWRASPTSRSRTVLWSAGACSRFSFYERGRKRNLPPFAANSPKRKRTHPETPRGTKQLVPRDLPSVCVWLEMEGQLRRVRPRRDEVRSAKRGQEVVERGLVRQVDNRETDAPLVVVTMEKVIIAHTGIEQVA